MEKTFNAGGIHTLLLRGITYESYLGLFWTLALASKHGFLAWKFLFLKLRQTMLASAKAFYYLISRQLRIKLAFVLHHYFNVSFQWYIVSTDNQLIKRS